MRRLKVAIFLCAMLIGFAAIASILPIISRDHEYHRRGPEVLAQANTSTWGGVIMQATGTFLNQAGKRIPPKELSLSLRVVRSQDGICVIYRKQCYWEPFERQSTIALARWITSSATGAFSAFDLSDDVVRKAGLTWIYRFTLLGGISRYAVAIEFRDTSLYELLRQVDFEGLKEELPNGDQIIAKHQALTVGSDIIGEGSYFISDLDSKFEFRLLKNKLIMTGTPIQYFWEMTDGRYARVTKVLGFVPEDKVVSILRAGVNNSDEPDSIANSFMFKQNLEVRKLRQAKQNSLFRRAALFRTIQIENSAAWERFIQEIATNYAADITQRVELEKTF
jgi:hypothetical protein